MSHWLYAGLYHSFSQTISRQITTWIVTRLRHTCITLHCALQQFSLQYQNVIGFSLLSYPIGLKNSRFFSSNQNKPKTNRESPPLVFPRFASATSNCYGFWLVHWIICVLCDWLEHSLQRGLVRKPGKHQRSKQRCQDLGWKVHARAKSFVLPS